MKRRSLLALPLLGWTARALGQDTPRRPRAATRGRQDAVDAEEPPRKRAIRVKSDRGEDQPEDGRPVAGPDEPGPAGLSEPDFAWKKFDISRYTALSPTAASPQTAILDWIFRRTETGPWHGDKPAVLCASRNQIRAYNSRKVLQQVAETVELFSDAYADVLSVRVRFLAAADSRWRYTLYSSLTAVGSGPQGQQIWQTADANIEQIIIGMQAWQGFVVLGDDKFQVLNGQTVRVANVKAKPYPGGVQRDGAVGMGFQPKVENLSEGIVLRFSPLLSREADTLDAAIELSTNLVRKFHQVKVLGPREVGTGEVSIDVPEVSETRLNQSVKTWPLGQALVISTGIQPGLLLDKGGWLNLKIPGTVPTGTEVLCVINVAITNTKPAREAAAEAVGERDPERPARRAAKAEAAPE